MQQRRAADRLQRAALQVWPLQVWPSTDQGERISAARTDPVELSIVPTRDVLLCAQTGTSPPDFGALASEQVPRLYSIARRLVGDEAEDAVQDCLLKAYRRYGELKAVSSAPAWLVSILVNCCRDRGRVRARSPRSVDFDSLERFSLYRKIAY